MSTLTLPTSLQVLSSFNGLTEIGRTNKKALHSDGLAFMRNTATALGLTGATITSYPCGEAVSGLVTLESDHLFVILTESCIQAGLWLIVRGRKSRHDLNGLKAEYVLGSQLQNREGNRFALETLEKAISDGRNAA